jgi:hypothetical protein
MIVYQLACAQGHFFEGWFASAEACDRQVLAGQLQCPACSSTQVRKLPAAPHVRASSAVPSGPAPGTEPAIDASERGKVIAALRRYILATTENVGRGFAEAARRIHYREEAPRGIRGQVTAEEAAELREEGVAAIAIAPEVLPSEEVH